MLAIALDPAIDRLRDGARTALRQKIANVLFVVAAIEDPPAELARRADEITINFPWGSLLRGVVLAEPVVIAGLAYLAKHGAPVRVLTAVGDRDAASGVTAGDLALLAGRATSFANAGLTLERCGRATTAEVEASGSTWAKRLDRPAVELHLRRDAAGAGAESR